MFMFIFSQLNVTLRKKYGNFEIVKTCLWAVGFDFAAGTKDGIGAFDFPQEASRRNDYI